MRIVEEGAPQLQAYESISIAFEVRARMRLEDLRVRGQIVADPVEPWLKNYDDCEEDRPTALARRFDMSHWCILSAFEGDQRLGGMIIARNDPSCEMLEGRTDLAVIFDVRVRPDARGGGIGRALFEGAKDRASKNGCIELRVETQDVNVPACRFYKAMGCDIHSVEEGAYGPEIDEAKLIWRIPL